MKRLIKLICLAVVGLNLMSCGNNKFNTSTTQIDIMQYRVPDSMSTVSQDSSVAATVWNDYYSDVYLRNLINLALENNYSFQSAALRMEKAAAYYTRCTGNFLPVLEFRVNQDQVKYQNQTTSYNKHGFGFALYNWEIDLWGKLRNMKRAGYASLMRENANLQGVKVRLIADVATLYYKLIGLDTKLKAVNEIIASNQEYLVEEEKRAGMTHISQDKVNSKSTPLAPKNVTKNSIAVEQAKAELFRAKAVKPDILAQLFITQNTLNLLLSRPEGSIPRAEIDEVLNTHFFNDTIDVGIPAELLQYRPDVMAAEYSVREAFHLHQAAKAAFYPALTISGNLNSHETNKAKWSDFSSTLVYNIFAGLSAPLLRKGELRYNRKVKELDKYERINNYKQTVLTACMEVSNTLMFYQMNQSKMVNLTKRYDALKNALSYSKILYNKNNAGYLDVLAAQSQLLQTRLELSDAFTRYFDCRISLYKALGGGAIQ